MGAVAAKGRVTRAARTAMTDIGNKANLLQNAKNLNKPVPKIHKFIDGCPTEKSRL